MNDRPFNERSWRCPLAATVGAYLGPRDGHRGREIDEGVRVTEELHQVRGRLDVAMDLIDKAVVGLLVAGSEQHLLDALFDATNALGVAASSIDDELRVRRFGPAA